jgi:hypothetical protein
VQCPIFKVDTKLSTQTLPVVIPSSGTNKNPVTDTVIRAVGALAESQEMISLLQLPIPRKVVMLRRPMFSTLNAFIPSQHAIGQGWRAADGEERVIMKSTGVLVDLLVEMSLKNYGPYCMSSTISVARKSCCTCKS